ncbi:MAG: sensor histidine kinase, partial [Gemmatimonadota bacterium]
VLFPRLLARRRIPALITGSVVLGLSSAALGVLVLYGFFGASQPPFSDGVELGGLLLWLSAIALIHIVIALVMRGFIDWYGDIKVKEELAHKTHDMELALIRSKLDPHFLFNTLNNIDVLIAKDPATASAYLNRFSDILRFVLYETDGEAIPLAAELAYIEKYIALERLRTANPRAITFDVAAGNDGLSIAPMMFIPFIENAFKHAESLKADDAVVIRLEVEGRRVTFQCRNGYRPANGSQSGKSGLGNDLIARRLALLYPGRHTLQVANHDGMYAVRLTLDL